MVRFFCVYFSIKRPAKYVGRYKFKASSSPAPPVSTITSQSQVRVYMDNGVQAPNSTAYSQVSVKAKTFLTFCSKYLFYSRCFSFFLAE